MRPRRATHATAGEVDCPPVALAAAARATTATPRARAATYRYMVQANGVVTYEKPRKRKPKPAGQFQSEHVLQIAVAQYLDRALPPDAFWTSIDSAGRGPRDGARMKRRGVRRGVPDVLVMWRDKTLWIELKSAKGRWPIEQKRFSVAADQAGHRYRLCRSLIEVQEAAEYFGVPIRARLT